MQKLPIKLKKRLESRRMQGSFRKPGTENQLVDFSSNDYLGFSASITIFETVPSILKEKNLLKNGATGSRLLTGNHRLYLEAEEKLKEFHKAEAALIFNSGYDANIGFFGTVPQRDDIILFDEYAHASIRDGISLCKARAYKFRHNDLDHLEALIERHRKSEFSGEIFIVTEAVFSMDGDMPDLRRLVGIAEKAECLLVMDEAHSIFVTGQGGRGMVEQMKLQEKIFARIITFGKGLGAHGAAVLGSELLRDYLINYCRSLIYTTALPPHSVATILAAYEHFEAGGQAAVRQLHENINYFVSEVERKGLQDNFLQSESAIHVFIFPGNAEVKQLSLELQEQGFDVKPILSPTVPMGKERLRFCLHSFNGRREMESVLSLLNIALQKKENG